MEITKKHRNNSVAVLGNVLAIGLASVCTTQQAAAATQIYGFSGNSATAWQDSSDGCGYSFVNVGGSDNKVQTQPGAPATTSSGFIYAYSYNWCTGGYRSAWGWSDNIAFNINAALNKASLSGTIAGTEYDNATCSNGCATNFSVNASWVGVGDLSSQSFNSRYSYGHVRYISNTRGNYRDADAAIAVSGGSWSINDKANGYMGTVRSHSINVTRP